MTTTIENVRALRKQCAVSSQNCRRLVLLAMVELALTAARGAEAYVLETGADTIDTAVTTDYESMTIGGDLTVTGTGWVRTPLATLNGGTLTVDGKTIAFGGGHSRNDNPTTFHVTNGVDGTCGRIFVKNGTAGSMAGGTKLNFASRQFYIDATVNETVSGSAIADVLSIDNSGVGLRQVYNRSSVTGRVSVTGTSYWVKQGGWCYGEGVFMKGGPWLVDLAEGATLTFTPAGQLGSFNEEGANARVTGPGNLLITDAYGEKCKMRFRKGAVLDNSGTLTFGGMNRTGVFLLEDDAVIGPHVKTINATQQAVYLEVPNLVTITVRNLNVSRASDRLFGLGTVRVDASDADCAFAANVAPTYVLDSKVYTNGLTVAKVGSHEATLASTNFPALHVLEGTARLMTNCVIASLVGAEGAKLVADGCVATLTGDVQLNGLRLETANGGAFAKAGAACTTVFGTGAVQGDLRVADGSLVFTNPGYTNKYWRWTFTKVEGTTPKPLYFGKCWLFDNEGGHAAKGLSYVTPTTALTSGKVRWACDPATNVAVSAWAAEAWWCGLTRLDNNFNENFIANPSYKNNFPLLTSPLVNPDDPKSYIAVEFRLKDTDKPVTGYNIATAYNTNYAKSWIVEASDDGETWFEVERRTDVTPVKVDYYHFYDGEEIASATLAARGRPCEHFRFTGYRRDGLAPLAEPLSLQVDADASVDLRAFAGGQAVDALTLDAARGGGTIRGGRIAANGVLKIVNAKASGWTSQQPLPWTVEDLADAANLKTWSVLVDGVSRKMYVELRDGKLVVDRLGTMVIVR